MKPTDVLGNIRQRNEAQAKVKNVVFVVQTCCCGNFNLLWKYVFSHYTSAKY